MKFLRTASTQRLLATIAGLVVAAGGGTAIAVAATGTGPVPAPKPLAQAIHDALSAPPVQGITAQISFTNHLIDSSDIQGSDPLLTGATGRLWLSSDHRLRLELQSDNGDAQVLIDGRSFSVYDPSSKTAYEGTLPAPARGPGAAKQKPTQDAIPTVAEIQRDLARLMDHVDPLSGTPSDVAGRAAYTVQVSPKHDGGLLGSGQLAWDALTGVPLRAAVYARGSTAPVLELKATGISYGPVPASDFAVSPPSGTKIVKLATPGSHGANMADRSGRRARRAHPEAAGPAAVARHLPFTLTAPGTLVGLPRRSVSLLDWAGHPAALVAYGQNLGGVAVIEQAAGASGTPSPNSKGDGHRGLSLPTVSIDGVTGQELDTALGTMVRFTRAGVAYTVIGSVPPVAADAAARGL